MRTGKYEKKAKKAHSVFKHTRQSTRSLRRRLTIPALAAALQPPFALFAKYHSHARGMLETFKTLIGPHLFGQDQHSLQHIALTSQFPKNLFFFPYRVGPDYQQQYAPGKVPKLLAQGIFVVTAEMPDRVLKVNAKILAAL